MFDAEEGAAEYEVRMGRLVTPGSATTTMACAKIVTVLVQCTGREVKHPAIHLTQSGDAWKASFDARGFSFHAEGSTREVALRALVERAKAQSA